MLIVSVGTMTTMQQLYILLAACIFCVRLCDSTNIQSNIVHNITHAEYTGGPGDNVTVTTPNYHLMPQQYEKMKSVGLTIDGGEPEPYSMKDGLIYTYSFINTNSSGTVRMIFKEYNLDPGSLLYVSILLFPQCQFPKLICL